MMPIPELKLRRVCQNCIYSLDHHCALSSSECVSALKEDGTKAHVLFTPKDNPLPNLLESCMVFIQENPGKTPSDYFESLRPTA